MVNEYKTIQRVGEWAGLTGDNLTLFLETAMQVHAAEHGEQPITRNEDGYSDEYFGFLNSNVFSDDDVLGILQAAQINSKKYTLFETGKVPIKTKAFQQYARIDYGLDEVIDFIMLLKLFDDYRTYTGEQVIRPRNKLYALIFTTNFLISEDSDLAHTQDTTLGNLEHTGYRYEFLKSKRGPFAETAIADKNRLYAYEYLEEEVIDKLVQQQEEPFELKLGPEAERFLQKFQHRLDSFSSDLLQEWNAKQLKAIHEYGELDFEGLISALSKDTNYNEKAIGEHLLDGRPWNFDEEAEHDIHSIAQVMANV